MDKVKLFSLLRESNFSVEDAIEYFGSDLQRAFFDKQSSYASKKAEGDDAGQISHVLSMHIKTPCEIMYVTKSGDIKYHNYLSLNKKDDVCGIKCGDNVFFKTNENPGTSYEAMFLASNFRFNGCIACIPKDRDICDVLRHTRDFNRTVEILNQNGISADSWIEKGYWTREKVEARKCLSGFFDDVMDIRLVIITKQE